MWRCIAISAAVMFLAPVSYARLSGEQSSGQELLQQVKQALKAPGKAWAGTMVSGKAVRGGVEHAYSFAFLPDGRFVQSFQGPDSKTLGNDGRRYWQEDSSHFVQELDLADRDRQMAINLLLSGNWLSAPAPIQLTASEGVLHLVFQETGVAIDVHVDPSTHLPTDASFQIPGGTVLKLSDWRVAGDRRIPMHVEVTTDGDTETYSADKARPIRPGDVHTTMPKPNVSDFTFDPAKPATVEASFAGKTHIMVRALVNGQDVGWFLLDSGAGAMVIDKALADSLHLKRLNRGSALGVGGMFESSARAVDKFEIGPMTLRNVRFGDYDFSSFNKGSGPRIAGTIGTPLYRRAVVVTNWKGPTVELYNRASFKLEKGAWQPLRFSSDNPAVLGRVAGTPESWYRLDTGASGSLTLHTPFVEKWKLLEGRETTASSSTGLGGVVSARTGTIDWFELGPHRFDNPTVVFSTATTGAFTDSYLAGNIGIDVLKSFTVVLDFTGSRVAFLK
ncbi:MAG TPA: retropepsin-like aspartic protease [Thermoanaerobaculia bacterium]|nr:retropepsin-like aspartic protease [Thermoanaerobaculia bacterium]